MARGDLRLTDFPAVAKEFDIEKNSPLTPVEVPAGSNKKRWWLCELGHSWEAVVASRTSKGNGCPFCSGRRAIPGQSDLATVFPELAKEWSPKNETSANEQTPFSRQRAWWIGECGHEFDMRISDRTARKQGCPFCSNRRPLAGFNDLASQKPEVAEEWHPTKNPRPPTEFTWGSNRKAWFKCKYGHEWETPIRARTSNGAACPFCSGNYVIPGETDIGTTHPELVVEWDDNRNTRPLTDFSSGSDYKAFWICKHGHSWQATISSRKSRGCPICAGRVIQKGFNDLETQRPELLGRWDYQRNTKPPSEVSMNSHHACWWLCEKGHSYKASVRSQMRGRGCAVCASRQILQGYNDLASQVPTLIDEWSPKNLSLTPHQVSAGSSRKAWWVCPRGHEYESIIYLRAKGIGCPVCDNKVVSPGFNDLATQRPDLVARWHPTKNSLSPSEVVVGSVKKVWWLCEEGHEWISTPANQSTGHDCPICGQFGYRGSLPGLFYLLDNEALGAAKVGITNLDTRNSRLKNLEGIGFKTVKTWKRQNGYMIRELETRTLNYIRKTLKLPPYLAKKDLGSFGGWKETFSREGISQAELITWVNNTLAEIERNV